MYSKHNEIEAIVEDLIEGTIIELFADSFSSKRECEIALEMLIDKLEEMDPTVFKRYFDK
jgi:HJR/Mrr/RecB family endonuclease